MLTESSYEARIAGVTRRHMEARFRWVSFDAVMVVLRTDPWDEESIPVHVGHDANGKRWVGAG